MRQASWRSSAGEEIAVPVSLAPVDPALDLGFVVLGPFPPADPALDPALDPPPVVLDPSPTEDPVLVPVTMYRVYYRLSMHLLLCLPLRLGTSFESCSLLSGLLVHYSGELS